jgi:hypothetical protein
VNPIRHIINRMAQYLSAIIAAHSFRESLRTLVSARSWTPALLMLFAFAGSGQIFAEPDDEYRIVNLILPDRTILAEGLEVKVRNSEVYLPLADILTAMGAQISSNKLGFRGIGFDGSILEWTSDSRVLSMGGTKVDAGLMVEDEAVWILRKDFDRIFQLKTEYFSSRELLQVTPEKELPLQRKKRRWSQPPVASGLDAASEDSVIIPDYRAFGGANLSLSASAGTAALNDGRTGQMEIATEMLYGSVHSSAQLTPDNFEFQSLRYSRYFPYSYNALGLGYTEFSLGDLNLVSNPLVGLPQNIQGVFLGNHAPGQATNSLDYDVVGTSQPGWDVEVFADGLLAGRTTANEAGEYAVRGIVLHGRSTRIKIEQHGPQGQFRVEERVITTVEDMKHKLANYRIAVGKTKRHQMVRTVSIDRSIGDSASLGVGVDIFDVTNEASKRYSSVNGLKFFGPLSLFADYIRAGDQDEYATRWKGSLAIKNLEFHIQREAYNKFQSFLVNQNGEGEVQREVAGARLSTGIALVHSISGEVRRSFFEISPVRRILNLRIGHLIGSVAVAQNWGWDFQGEPSFDIGASIGSAQSATRLAATQEAKSAPVFSIKHSRRVGKLWEFALDLQGARVSELVSSIALKRSFEHIDAGLTFGYDKVASALLTVGSTLWMSENPRRWSADARGSVDHASVELDVFVDSNHNSLRDEDEEGLAGVRFKVNGVLSKVATDQTGHLRLLNLGSNQSAVVEVIAESIEDPSIASVESLKTLFVRPGSTHRVNWPLKLNATVEGRIRRGESEMAMSEFKEYRIELKSNHQLQPAFVTLPNIEGAFTLQDVPLGAYTLAVFEILGKSPVIEIMIQVNDDANYHIIDIPGQGEFMR